MTRRPVKVERLMSDDQTDAQWAPQKWWRDPDEFWQRYESAGWNLTVLAEQHGMHRATLMDWKKRHVKSGGDRCPFTPSQLKNAPRLDRGGVAVAAVAHEARTGHAPSVRASEEIRVVDPIEIVALRRKLERATIEVSSLRKQLKTGIRHENLLEDIAALAEPMLEQYPGTVDAAMSRAPAPMPTSASPVEIIVYLTDWHIGETIDPEDVQGRNRYSVEIAAQRVEHLAGVLDQWRDEYAERRGVARVTFAILGDMVNNAGVLHPGQSVDAIRVLAQALDASLLMYQTIRPTILSGIPVRIVTTRGGNHGRSQQGKMPSGPAAAQTSWDGVAYEHLAAMLRGEQTIEWHMSRAYSATIDVAGKVVWVAHGDAIKGGGGSLGIPAYGAKRQSDAAVMASVLEAIQRECAGRIVQHVRVGHFHEETLIRLPTGTFKICPSIKGTSAWELDTLGKISQPEALIEVVHPQDGIIATHVVDCSRPTGAGFVTGAMRSTQPAAALVD